MNAILLLLAIQGCSAFTTPSFSNTRRTSFVTKPFNVATELTSEGTPEEPAIAVPEEADQIVAEAEAVVEAIVEEAVDDAISEIKSDDSSTENEAKRVLRERHTVFLGNLPFELTKDETIELGAQYGEVKQINVPLNRDSGLPRGFAFIDYATAEEAQAAIDNLDGFLFKGRNIRASVSDPGQKKTKSDEKLEKEDVAKVYVGNIPFETSKEELLEFYKGFVDAVEAYIPINRDTGAGRGFGFVTIKSGDVQSAIDQTNGIEYEGRPLIVNLPLPPGQRKERRPTMKDRTKLYVGNLAFNSDIEILTEVFGEFGEVVDCYLPEDPVRGGSRGFGFVTMERENALEAINELDGCELDGRFIRVNEALPKGKAPKMNDGDDNDEF
mmetsp:Transcript_14332/g.18729  ORF Transcript_14332/g.18729 Transcript_14332/m.18729 type:complete len:383 (-) Transcript_14332:146-1294(-)